jgi:opacity protein-like surface antigen
MKKIVLLTALVMLYASSAFASASATTLTLANGMALAGNSVYGAKGAGTTASTSSPLIGKTSTGVGMGYSTAPAGYALATQHKNGTKAYGSSFDSTSIYSKDVVTVGTGEAITFTTGVDSFPTSSWSSM